MGMLDTAKLDFSIRRTAFEARFAGGQGGHRFWLYLFNVVASLVLFLWLAWAFGDLVVFLACAFIVLGFVIFFEVDNAWRDLTDWRRGENK